MHWLKFVTTSRRWVVILDAETVVDSRRPTADTRCRTNDTTTAMKSILLVFKRTVQFAFFLFVTWAIGSLLAYRIPATASPVVFEGPVHYKVLELGLTNRDVFEMLMPTGLRIARIVDAPELYVIESDHARLWKEDPFSMREKGYTMKVRMEAQPLLFGGYGRSKVVTLERIKGEPAISK